MAECEVKEVPGIVLLERLCVSTVTEIGSVGTTKTLMHTVRGMAKHAHCQMTASYALAYPPIEH